MKYLLDTNICIYIIKRKPPEVLEGSIIGAMDMLIAAQAIAWNLILVTNNTDEFQRIPELRLENWVNR